MKQSKHIKILIAIAIIAGALGGVGNYFMLDLKLDSTTNIMKPIILGIIAAAVLPLFLKLVSSNILDFVEENLQYKNYFNFMSLCLLAALFADVFLQGIYAKVFNEFTDEIAIIDQKIEHSNEKVDYALYNIKNEKEEVKNQNTTNEAAKNLKIQQYAQKFNLNKTEAAIYYKITENKISEAKELYEFGDKAKIDSTLTKFKKENLVKEFDVNKTKMIVPKTNFTVNRAAIQKINN